MHAKTLKVMMAVTVVSAGTYTFVPHSLADTTSVIEQQNPSANTLENLLIDGVQLDKAFSSNLLDYHATVENDVKSVALHLTGNENEAITINGNAVSDPSNIQLDVYTGENQFLIVVNDGVNPSVTYTLTITRKASGNNLLQNIKLSSGKLSKAFDPSIKEYDVQVQNVIDELTVTPEVFDSTEIVKVNGMVLNQGRASVKLPVGKSNITIEVTAENGEINKYILHVVRAEGTDHKTPPKNPTGNNGNGKPNKGFPDSQTGQKNKGNMNIGKDTSSQGAYSQGKSSQGAYGQGNANQGTNVQGSQGAGSQIKQSQAQLSSLSVSSGTWNKTFSRDAYTYHIAVGSSVDSVKVDEVPQISGASVSINGGKSTIQLGENAKKTIISVVVTKGDDRKTYVLVFDKAVKAKKTTTSVITTPTSNNTVQTNTSSVPNHFEYANQNNTKQSASWWGRLWTKIKSWF